MCELIAVLAISGVITGLMTRRREKKQNAALKLLGDPRAQELGLWLFKKLRK